MKLRLSSGSLLKSIGCLSLAGLAICALPGLAGASSNPGLQAKVNALIAGKQPFPKPTTSVNPGTHKIAIIAVGLVGGTTGGPGFTAAHIDQALKVIGWTAPPVFNGEFTPSTESSLIESAVQQKYDALILIGITPSTVSAAISSATSVHVPIVCIDCGPGLPKGVTGVGSSSVGAGVAQAEYAVSKSPKNGTIVVYETTQFAVAEQQAAATVSEVKKLCPGCKVETPSYTESNSTVGDPIYQQLLKSNPSGHLTWVVMQLDADAAALAQTAQQEGRNDFGIIGTAALAPYVNMVGTGSPPDAKADELNAQTYYAWAAVDQAARLLAGKPTWNSTNVPVALITKANYPKYAGKLYNLPPFNFQQVFTKLWGK
jgi:ribose transport system substrate-binding protein